MLGRLFKILTIFLICLANNSILWSKVLTQEEYKTHLRWTINSEKKQILTNKNGKILTLETLDDTFYDKFVEEISKLESKTGYLKKIEYSKENFPAKPAQVKIELKDQSIELFSFYKDQDKQLVLDFWINKDLIQTKKTSVSKKVAIKKNTKKVVKKSKKPVLKIIKPKEIKKITKEKQYRDFRYGAAFLWNYDAIIPPLEKDINISIKAPDYLYEVKNRDYESDPKEAHMQLSIKFYRQKKYGHMTKSITLYEKKYGNDINKDINDFMKATSLIKNTIKEVIKPFSKETINNSDDPESLGKGSESGTVFAGINILINVAERTKNPELKIASLRYVLQYYLDKKDFIKGLHFSKKLYVTSSEILKDEMTIYSSRVILYSLAQLKQRQKMQEFLNNKAVRRLLPAQEGLAYLTYIQLQNKNIKEIIKKYEENEKSLSRPLNPSLLFNTAEAYFRNAEYEKSLKLFDEFVYNYQFLKSSSQASLRLAVCYDLLEKPVKEILNLYENAINRSSDPKITYEAKVRYVGLRVARNKKVDKRDSETLAFLDKTPAEKKIIKSDLKKILWLVRLRSFISLKRFDDALAYLSTIPLDTLNLVDRRVFEGDGAEIVLGLIKKMYLSENYARATKVWEVYKNKYEDKVAKSPYLNFLVSDSFLKLRLFDSFDRSYKELKNIQNQKIRTFPVWVEEHKKLSIADYLKELELIQLVEKKEWKKVNKYLLDFNESDKKKINYNFYKGIVAYHLKKYNEAIEDFETILVSPNEQNVLSPRQTAMMLQDYIESLYQIGNKERFQKNALALIGDISNTKDSQYKKISERIEYLLIESLSSDGNNNELLKRSTDFLTNYKDSSYVYRVKFLYGVSLLKNNQDKLGEKTLNDLISTEDTPSYLKGLARSELSSLAIKNKTL